MSVPPTGAIIAARIRKEIRQFEQAEAFSERSARNPEELGIRKCLIFTRLVNAGVFIETSGNRYYLHHENLAAYQSNRRKRIIFFLLIIIGVIVFMTLISK